MLLYPDTPEIVVDDCDATTKHVVALNIESVAELGRVATNSPLDSATLQSPVCARHIYACLWTTASRKFVCLNVRP